MLFRKDKKIINRSDSSWWESLLIFLDFTSYLYCLTILRYIVQTKGMFLLIGAQQNVYLAFSGNFICSIMLAKNLKSSIRHRVYKLEGKSKRYIREYSIQCTCWYNKRWTISSSNLFLSILLNQDRGRGCNFWINKKAANV